MRTPAEVKPTPGPDSDTSRGTSVSVDPYSGQGELFVDIDFDIPSFHELTERRSHKLAGFASSAMRAPGAVRNGHLYLRIRGESLM